MTDAPDSSIQLLAEAAQNESRNLKDEADTVNDQDDRSSSLSDLEERPAIEGDECNHDKSSSASEEEEDTEAETERLEESPHKIRKQKIVHLGVVNNLFNGDSPSTGLGEPTLPGDGTSVDKFGKPDLAYSSDVPDATSEISSLEDSAAEGSPPDSPTSGSSKKRKRTEDTTAKSLKKVAIQLANHVADSMGGHGSESTTLAATSLNGEHQVEEAEATDGEAEESAVEDQVDDDNTIAEAMDNINNIDSNDEDVDMEDAGQEPDAGPSGRNEEELIKKKAALDMLTKIEKDFALLRDRLFAERTKQLNEELATLESPNITHPEYLSIVEAISSQRKERIAHARTVFKYKAKALQTKSVAERTQHFSQYMQTVREIRDKSLEQANKEWYQTQRERRTFDDDKINTTHHLSTKRSEQVAQQTAYNNEVSILSGIAKYVGFPAAPEIEGASSTEIEDDLRKMGISRQPTAVNVPSSISQHPRQIQTAEDLFIEQTPWANPQHRIHSQMLNNTQRQVSAHMRPTSPFTPHGQKRPGDSMINGSGSTIPAHPSSSLAPTPMSTDPLPLNHQKSHSSLAQENSIETPSRLALLTDRGDAAPANHYASLEGTGSKNPGMAINRVAIHSSPPTKPRLPSSLDNLPHSTKSPQRRQAAQGLDETAASSGNTRLQAQFPSHNTLQASVKVGNA